MALSFFPPTTLPAVASLTSPSGTGKPPAKLAEKGTEFESMLLTQWLQAAETSFGSVPGAEDEDQGDAQMRSFGVQQLASAISHAGGIGIGRMVTQALERSESSAPKLPEGKSVTK